MYVARRYVRPGIDSYHCGGVAACILRASRIADRLSRRTGEELIAAICARLKRSGNHGRVVATDCPLFSSPVYKSLYWLIIAFRAARA